MRPITFPPSPNWFLNDVLAVGSDGYIVYGSSSNGITVLSPNGEADSLIYKFKSVKPAHKGKVTCIALSPDWLTSRMFVSAAEDGYVKLWNATTLSFSIAHNIHFESKETIVGSAFLKAESILSIGNLGVIVIWNSKVNSVRVEKQVFKSYKPLCLSVCPQKDDTVAVGTKQGVVLVLSITDKVNILYKAHGHDTDVTSLSWCPTSECVALANIVAAKRGKTKVYKSKKSLAKRIPPVSGSEELNESVVNLPKEDGKSNLSKSGLYEQSSGEEADESDIFDIYKDYSYQEFGHRKYVVSPSDSEDNEKESIRDGRTDKEDKYTVTNLQSAEYAPVASASVQGSRNEKNIAASTKNDSYLNECNKLLVLLRKEPKEPEDDLETSDMENGTNISPCKRDKTLSESTMVPDDSDFFDIYKDHLEEEFGHWKSTTVKQPESDAEHDKPPPSSLDFLQECEKLKKRMTGIEDTSLTENETSLSTAFDKLQVGIQNENDNNSEEIVNALSNVKINTTGNLNSQFFLASCCKNGKVCIWRWGGGLVSSGSLLKEPKNDRLKTSGHPWGTVCWLTTSTLLAASKGSQLLRCDFQNSYSKSKSSFGYTVIHDVHQRGSFLIACSKDENLIEQQDWRAESAPSIAWTVGQDRYLVAYSMDQNKVVASYTTFGGFVYDIAASSIDPSRFAIGSGDGMVRVWNSSSPAEELVEHHWNGVQGKVQCVAWHPSKEHLIAYGNSEGRVGIIEAGTVKQAKVLAPGLPLGAFHICWGPKKTLFACGGGTFVVYNVDNTNKDPGKILVTVLEREWSISTMIWNESYLTVGSSEGGVALLKPESPYDIICTAYPHKKNISCIAWHPPAVSSEDGVSPYADLLAVSSRSSTVVILKCVKTENDTVLEIFHEISIHTEKVNRLCWSPHNNGWLLSVSDDSTIKIWDVLNKCLLHSLFGHEEPVLCAIWSPTDPQFVISGAEDHSLRVWDIRDHPPLEGAAIKKKQRKKLKLASIDITFDKADINVACSTPKPQVLPKVVNELGLADGLIHSDNLAVINKPKKSKADFCFSIVMRQIKSSLSSPEGCRRLHKWNIAKRNSEEDCSIDYSCGYDYLRVYGSHNEIVELLDMEQKKHEETYNWEKWAMVGIIRGDVRRVLERAVENHKLNPSLLCFASSVSHRFWKEMFTAYGIQLERQDNEKPQGPDLCNVGPLLWRGAVLLANGMLEEACELFSCGGLGAEALCVAQVRHADHLRESCLKNWASFLAERRKFSKAAECYIALGLYMDAAVTLGKSNDEEDLAFAAVIAKYAGNQSLADGLVQQTNI